MKHAEQVWQGAELEKARDAGFLKSRRRRVGKRLGVANLIKVCLR